MVNIKQKRITIKMSKIKITDNSGATPSVISPTQNQMDEWIAQELAEESDIQMLGDDDSHTLFDEPQSASMD